MSSDPLLRNIRNPLRARGLGADPTIYFSENLFGSCKSPQKFGFSLKQQQNIQVFFGKIVSQNFVIL